MRSTSLALLLSTPLCLIMAPPAFAQSTDAECEGVISSIENKPATATVTKTPSPVASQAGKPGSGVSRQAGGSRSTPASTKGPVRVPGANGTVAGQPVKIKDGSVRTGALTPPMQSAMGDIYSTAKQQGLPTPVITSAKDGDHMNGSRHYSGNAVDLRCNSSYASARSCSMFAKNIKSSLGSGYDVVFEDFGPGNSRNHVHVEYDPKKGRGLG